MKIVVALLSLCSVGSAFAHGFEERYDLPVPLSYVVVGACSVVFFTFLVAALFMRAATVEVAQRKIPQADSEQNQRQVIAIFVRAMSWCMAVLVLVSAVWGTTDPLMNLAPTFVWIIWWVGLGFVVVLIGNVWPMLDPWATTFDVLNQTAKRCGFKNGMCLGLRWPQWLGAWPATFLLLAWSWAEVVYPVASNTAKLGWFIVAWTVTSLLGMVFFGKQSWQAHGDVFSLYFSTLGRVSLIHRDSSALNVAGHVAFVVAMLSTVLFDGLRSGGVWAVFEATTKKLLPIFVDINGYFVGTLGLFLVWLVFLFAYLITCFFCERLMAKKSTQNHFYAQLAFTLIPIAAAYNVAHNFSNLLIQGQTFLQLLSDPLGRQWDIFGTAKLYPNIGIVDAKLTWFVAVSAIVLGHVVSIWLAHKVALRNGQSPIRTALAMLPLTLLMVLYTAASLLVIAEPMVVATP